MNEPKGHEYYIGPEAVVFPDPEPPRQIPPPARSQATPSPSALPPPDGPPTMAASAAPPAEPAPTFTVTPYKPPTERRDPYADIRDLPWMDPALSAAGRVMARLRPELDAFAAIEGRGANGADIDALVKKHVDYMAPILQSEQASQTDNGVSGKGAAERRSAIALPAPAWAPAAGAVPEMWTAASRAGGVALGAGAAAATAGAATLLVPTNYQGETYALGEGLRVRRRVGQASLEIERQVDSGLFGSGIGAKWEQLPVAARFTENDQGQQLLQVDSDQLQQALGKEVADRLIRDARLVVAPQAAAGQAAAEQAVAGQAVGGQPGAGQATTREADAARAVAAKEIGDALVRRIIASPAGPGGSGPPRLMPMPGYLPITEMRLTSSVDGGVTITHAEIAEADVAKFCANYPRILQVGMNASAAVSALGVAPGPKRGRMIHSLAADALKTLEIERQLRMGGMQQLFVEQGFLGNELIGYLRSGASKIDVVEKISATAACIYDFKTRTAVFTVLQRGQYLIAVATYLGVTTIYVLGVWVP